MFEVANDQTGPRIKQLSVFLSNRLGALLKVTRALEGKKVRICAISILDSADHAVIRLVVDRPSSAMEVLVLDGFFGFPERSLGRGVGPRRGD